MSDITELVEQFEKNKYSSGTGTGSGQGRLRIKCIAIHSDIPFEEQLMAFQPAGETIIPN